jgi:4-amino-4-deoxy-L-arabinose transferase-like glycosyltransferase
MLFLAFFSFAPALVIVWVMNRWSEELLPTTARLGAELMLLTTGFFIGSAIVLRMDMLMCMFIVLALYTFFQLYQNNGTRLDSVLFPVYVFLALFTKGPVGLLVPLVSVVVFLIAKGEIRTIGRYWGWKTLTILALLCGIWFSFVYIEGGSQYFNNLVFKQTVTRAINASHHQEPFYYYLIAFWYTMAPWSLLILTVFWKGLRKCKAMTDVELFFAIAGFSTLLFLSASSSKLAIYLLPAFPFFIYLTLIWLLKYGYSKWMALSAIVPSAILCVALPATIAFKYLINNDINISIPIILSSALLSATGILSLKYLLGKKVLEGVQVIATGTLIAVFVVAFAIPELNQFIGLKQLCEKADAIAKSKGGVNYYYCEMSRAGNMDVYLKASLTELRKHDLPSERKIKTPALVFISRKAIEENDTVKSFIKGRNSFYTGNYYCIEIENKKQNNEP